MRTLGNNQYKRTSGSRSKLARRMYRPRISTAGVATFKNGRSYAIRDDGWRRIGDA